jgi:ubiquinone/menaquinone biosynthesis C-methylase UbiE
VDADDSIDRRHKVSGYDHPSTLFTLGEMLKGLFRGPFKYRPYFKTLGLKGNEKVLDFGCGGGIGSRSLLKFLNQQGHLTCVDASNFWIDKARKRLKKYSNVECLVGDIRELDIADSAFDIILILNVIHHIPPVDRQDTVKTLSRKLKEDGTIFVREPTKKSHGTPIDEILALFSEAGLKETAHKEVEWKYRGSFKKPHKE